MHPFRKIVIIDDDELSNVLNEKIITDSGFAHEVIVYNSPFTALEAFKQSALYDHPQFPDVIILDINMPVMSGWQFLEVYKTFPEDLTAKCRLFMLSGAYNFKEFQLANTHNLVRDFVQKPLTILKLNELLQQH